jgi:hypothetical protein
MGAHSELAKWNPEAVLQVSECIMWSNDELIPKLQEVLSVEGHLWAQPTKRINPNDLDKLPVNVIPDDLVQHLSRK